MQFRSFSLTPFHGANKTRKLMRSGRARLAANTAAKSAPLWRHCRACSSEPPPSPTTFPAWRPLDFFHFEILHQSRRSNARVGRCVDMRMHTHEYGPLLCAVRSLHCNAHSTVAPQQGVASSLSACPCFWRSSRHLCSQGSSNLGLRLYGCSYQCSPGVSCK